MRQEPRGPRFGLEILDQLGMGHSRALFGDLDSLDRDGATNRWVLRAVNDTHAAAAQFAQDFIPTDFCGCDHLPIPKE